MHQKLAKKGVVLIGLSDETDSKVSKHLSKYKTPYIIGSGSKSAKKWGILGYPTAFVVDTTGKVTFKGHPADPKFKEAIEDTMKKTPPKPGLPFVAAQAAEAYKRAGKLAKKKQWAEVIDLLEMIVADYGDTKHAGKAKKRLAKIKADEKIMTAVRDAEAEKKCGGWLEMARNLAKAGKDEGARKYYKRIIGEFGDSTFAETARKEMAEL